MKWKILPPASDKWLSLCSDIPPLLAQLLYNRGIRDPSQIEPFLAADERLGADPLLLPDMGRAVARILRALINRETIAVYGDFDADGVTATALLSQGLSNLGGKVIPYIPHRIEEGHGLNSAALKKLSLEGVSLVITVDCGISAYKEAKQAREMGLDLIITDHHSVVGPLPPALAVINPKRDDSTYPFRELAGVGVAFKLLQQLFRTTGRGEHLDEFLDLVALGTVADLVPLLGENRYLVKRGLEVLNTTNRLGIKELINCAGLKPGLIDTDTISYILAPRLNATGRLDHALTSYDLLTTESPDKAQQLAKLLELRNAERQKLTDQILTQAEEKIKSLAPDTPLLMIGDKDFHIGVNGIVASKLVDRFYRPALVLELGEEESRGSARSIPEFDLMAALSECQEFLSHFGGHAQAAGFTLPSTNIGPLQEKLLAIAKDRLGSVELHPSLNIEAEVPLTSLGGQTFEFIKKLEPFGQANPVPVFLTRGVKLIDCHQVGNENEHLKFKIREGEAVWDAIGFGLGKFYAQVSSSLDIVYNLRAENWGGREFLELEILDFAPAGENSLRGVV